MFKSECQKSWARGIRERCNVIRDSEKPASLAAGRLCAELLRGRGNRQGSCVTSVRVSVIKGQRTPRQTNQTDSTHIHTHTQRERERVRESLCLLQNQLGICVNANELFFFCLHSQQTVRGISLHILGSIIGSIFVTRLWSWFYIFFPFLFGLVCSGVGLFCYCGPAHKGT